MAEKQSKKIFFLQKILKWEKCVSYPFLLQESLASCVGCSPSGKMCKYHQHQSRYGSDTKKQLKDNRKYAKYGGLKSRSEFSVSTVFATSDRFCSISAILGMIWMISSLSDILIKIIDNWKHLGSLTFILVFRESKITKAYIFSLKSDDFLNTPDFDHFSVFLSGSFKKLRGGLGGRNSENFLNH